MHQTFLLTAIITNKRSIPDWVVFAIGFACWLINRWMLNEPLWDDAFRMVGALNLLDGQGYGYQYVDTNDWQIKMQSLWQEWPVMQSWLLSKISLITHNVRLSWLVMEVIFGSILCASIFALIQDSKHKILRNIGYIALMCSPVFTSLSRSTDLYSAACFAFALWYFMSNFRQKAQKISFLLLSSFLFSIPFVFRFAYTPMLAFPCLLFVCNYYGKTSWVKLIQGLVVCSVFPLLFFMGQKYLIYRFGEGVVYTDSQMFSGFFPLNLLNAKPVFAAYFLGLNTGYLTEVLDKIFSGVNIIWWKSLGFVLMILEGVLLFKAVQKLKSNRERSEAYYILVLVILLVFLPLYILSTIRSYSIQIFSPWAFCVELRYYLPAVIAAIAVLPFIPINFMKAFQAKWIKALLIISVFLHLSIHTQRVYSKTYSFRVDHVNIYNPYGNSISPTAVELGAKDIFFSNNIYEVRMANKYGFKALHFYDFLDLQRQLALYENMFQQKGITANIDGETISNVDRKDLDTSNYKFEVTYQVDLWE